MSMKRSRPNKARARRSLAGICAVVIGLCAYCAVGARTSMEDGPEPSNLVTDPSGAPTVPPHGLAWPGVAVILIVALFVTAAVAGPLIRANLRDVEDSQSSR